MNQKYRILHADDSSVVRKLLGEVFERSQKCEIAFSAKHGKEAVDNFRRIDPDVVVLDVEMPVMDGIEATTAIRAMSPQVPIIMCSSLTTRGGEATLDALARGATDYVAKPTGSGHLDDALKQLSDELVPKVLTWAARYRKHPAVGDEGRALASTSHPPVQRTSRAIEQDGGRRPRRAAPVRVVAVGVSTGGPTALASLLSQLPRDLDVPILIAQHMPPIFTTLLAERLSSTSPFNVKEAVDGQTLSAGQVWIAPGDYHLTVVSQGARFQSKLCQSPPENSCRPSVDVLFRSVATAYRDTALAIVLTGMGKDGVAGAEKIQKAGGRVFVQDEASSTVWGMPRAVWEAGLADKVVPLGDLPNEIARTVGRSTSLMPMSTA